MPHAEISPHPPLDRRLEIVIIEFWGLKGVMAIFESCAYALTFNKPPLHTQLKRYHFLRVHFQMVFHARFVWQKKLTAAFSQKHLQSFEKRFINVNKKKLLMNFKENINIFERTTLLFSKSCFSLSPPCSSTLQDWLLGNKNYNAQLDRPNLYQTAFYFLIESCDINVTFYTGTGYCIILKS